MAPLDQLFSLEIEYHRKLRCEAPGKVALNEASPALGNCAMKLIDVDLPNSDNEGDYQRIERILHDVFIDLVDVKALMIRDATCVGIPLLRPPL